MILFFCVFTEVENTYFEERVDDFCYWKYNLRIDELKYDYCHHDNACD